MIVEKLVGRSVNSELFNMLVRCLEHIHQQYAISGREAVAPIMETLYNITISELTKLDDGTNVHVVRWHSEQSYAWFVLRWA